jgi:cation diffusion facilitator CzcD-associated flavoprotein CzcO
MAPGLLDPLAEFESKFGISDLDALPAKFGWATKDGQGYHIKEQLCGTERPLRVIHIGAGASGILLAKYLPEQLKNVSFTCYDKNPEIGGTWYENKFVLRMQKALIAANCLLSIFRYPGCACDIPSANYQYTWARNPRWSQFYSPATEIFQYLKDVVDSFDLAKHMKLQHMVTGAYWKEESGLWEVHITDLTNGTTFIDRGEVLINGTGLLK